ncbi:GNAT family N-acetyltransferase [Microvirga pudoricolor]|uniref:GNAT family N-acetyltransferase n=1 Tax=Microvirga pudoricolor TaxID=2778729 RepID=UPI0019514916|nr:GNAT family N-acetyltransferase [Microvirga pudoricolor]MBM6596309.1 GNAT family N-acetyltransferase [Microvirga pudoricolor]
MHAQRPFAHAAPPLETDRLLLRAHTARDLDAACSLWNHPMVVENITGKTAGTQEIWFRILRYAGLWPLLGYGYWAVEEKSTGRFVGDVGFADFHRDIEPSLLGIPEAGWLLDPGHHGKGYATEAVLAVLRWLDRGDAGSSSVCIISPTNEASLRVADKCGYRETHRTVFNERPTMLLRRDSCASHPRARLTTFGT